MLNLTLLAKHEGVIFQFISLLRFKREKKNKIYMVLEVSLKTHCDKFIMIITRGNSF